MLHCLSLYIWERGAPWRVQVGGKIGQKIDTDLKINPTDLGACVTSWKWKPSVIYRWFKIVWRYVMKDCVKMGDRWACQRNALKYQIVVW